MAICFRGLENCLGRQVDFSRVSNTPARPDHPTRVTYWLASSRMTPTPSTVTLLFMGSMWRYFSSTFSLLRTRFPVI